MSLRVIHIGKYFPPHRGGMETYLSELSREQCLSGLDVQVLVHASEPGSRDQRTQRDGFTVERAPILGTLVFTPIALTFPLLLRSAIRRQRPDVIHIHLPNVSAFWLLLLPGARKIPWVIHWHSDVPVSKLQWTLRLFYRLYAPLERALLRRASAVIATSPPYLDSSPPLQPFRDKCVSLPLGISDIPPEPDSHFRCGDEALRVLVLGRLAYYKGVDIAIRAAATLHDVELHIVGDGELRGDLTQLAEELAPEKVTFHGALDDQEARAQLRNCDCLCLPSIERSEAFGMVLLEAMACGKPTIASDVSGSGMAWVLDGGSTGLLVQPGDPGALAEAFERLRAEPQLCVALGERGRARFEEKFTIAESSRQIVALYERLE